MARCVTYFERLLELMIYDKLTFSKAIMVDLFENGIDENDVYAVSEYMESCGITIDQVEHFMGVFYGYENDYSLIKQ